MSWTVDALRPWLRREHPWYVELRAISCRVAHPHMFLRVYIVRLTAGLAGLHVRGRAEGVQAGEEPFGTRAGRERYWGGEGGRVFGCYGNTNVLNEQKEHDRFKGP